MTKAPTRILDLPMAERGLMALKAAVEKVIAEHAKNGLPIYIWRDGKVVEVPAAELRAGLDARLAQNQRQGMR